MTKEQAVRFQRNHFLDRVHIFFSIYGQRAKGAGHAIEEVKYHIADNQHAGFGMPERDMTGGMSRCVDDVQTAQNGQHFVVIQAAAMGIGVSFISGGRNPDERRGIV